MFPFQCPGLKNSQHDGKLPNKFPGLRDPKVAELQLLRGWWAPRWKWKWWCWTREVVVSWSNLETADAALLNTKEVDAHPVILLLSSACLVLLSNNQSDCQLWQHHKPYFPTHERLLDCFSDLLGTNKPFIDTNHACLLTPPHLSSPAKALCPLPAAYVTHSPLRGTEGHTMGHSTSCCANSPCPMHRRAERGQKKVHYQKLLGYDELLVVRCFLQVSFEEQSWGCSLGMVKWLRGGFVLRVGKDIDLFGRTGLFGARHKDTCK